MQHTQPLSTVLAAIGASRDDFNNWLRRGHLKTDVIGSTPGAARMLTRNAALELAFVHALVGVGIEPEIAGAVAREWVAAAPPPWFVHNPISGRSEAFGDATAQASLSNLFAMLPDHEEGDFEGDEQSELPPGTRLVCVHVGGIRERIESVYSQ